MFSDKRLVSDFKGKPPVLFRILLLAFSLVFSNAFFSLYQPYIPIIPHISLFNNILGSIIIGVLVSIVLYYITKFIMNNEELSWSKINVSIKINHRTGYVLFIAIILILSSIFTAQTIADLSPQDHTMNYFYQGDFALSPDNSKLAYLTQLNNGSQDIVIKDLQDNSKTNILPICPTKDSCVNLLTADSLSYNLFGLVFDTSSHLLLYGTSVQNSSITRFNFDLQTDKLSSIKSNYPNENNFVSILNTKFVQINSSIYYATFSYDTNSTNIGTNPNGFVYIKLINDFTNASFTLQVPLKTNSHVLNMAISPDLTKLALSDTGYFYFYSLKRDQNTFNATFLDESFIASPPLAYEGVASYVSWSNDYSTLYYASYNDVNQYSGFFSFNFNTSQYKRIAYLQGSYNPVYVNQNDSYFITTSSPTYEHYTTQIYSFKDSSVTLLQNKQSFYVTSIGSANQFIAVQNMNSNPSKLLLMSYNSKSNTITTNAILDVTSYQISSILNQVMFFLTVTTVIIVFVLILELIVDNSSNISKKTVN